MYKLISDINALLNEKENNVNVYYAVDLTEGSQKKVAEYANYKNIDSHHVTIAYRPSFEVAKKLESMLGQEIGIETIGLYENDRIQAFAVKMNNISRLDDGPAHITVSHVDGARSRDSKEMFKAPERVRNIQIKLNGKLVRHPITA